MASITFWDTVNPCSFYQSKNQAGRKAIIGELFLSFIVFLVQNYREPLHENKTEVAVPDNQAPAPEKSTTITLTQEYFNNLLNHSICVGLVLWSAAPFGVIISWIHFAFLLMFYLGTRTGKDIFGTIGRIGTVVINIVMIITGIVGLSSDSC